MNDVHGLWCPRTTEAFTCSERLEHDISSETQVRLSVFGADDRFKLLIKSPSAEDPAFSGEFGGYTRFIRTQLRLASELAPDARWVNTLAWGLTDSDQAFGTNGFASTAHDLTFRSDVRVALADAVTFNGGVDAWLHFEEIRAQFRPYPESNAVSGPYFARPARRVEASASLIRPGVYAGLELRPWRAFRLLPSVRADYVHDTEEVTLDPRLGARWDLTPSPARTTLKAGLGWYHQPPRVEESHERVGTDGVESSRALHASLGIERELAPGFEVSLEGFYKRLDQLIVARAEERRILGARFENTGEGRVYGAETLLRYKPEGGRFFGWIAYTLSRSERRDRPSERYTTFEWDQTHILSVVANVDLGRGWTTGGRFRFVTGSPFSPYHGGLVDLDAGAYSPLRDGAIYSARLGDFHQLDLRVEKEWVFAAWKLAAYLEVRNVYNRENPEGVTYSYDYGASEVESGLPILPVLGVRGEL